MRMTKLRALARERDLRGYSKLRKAELIAFLQDNEYRACRQPPARSMGPSQPIQQPLQEIPPTKRQLKHRRAKDSKLAKCLLT